MKNKLILGGNLDMVEDLLWDREGGNPNNTHLITLNHLSQIKQTNNLVEIWWKENPNKKRFSLLNCNYSINSRINRFYINSNQRVENISIFPNPISDHNGLIPTLKLQIQHLKVKVIRN